MKKFSFIIPVYNSESFLNRCIESIISQTYTNFEIILVDDGSKDNSLVVCNEWKSKDKRIIVKLQENQGPGKARLNGFKEASGELIFFVDSDDYLTDENALNKIADIYDKYNPDIVFFNLIIINNQNISKIETPNGKNDIKIGFNQLEILPSKHINVGLYSKVFKKNILKEKMFYFSNCFEDFYTSYLYLNKCKNYYYLNEDLYCLYHGADNTSHLSSVHNIEKEFVMLNIINLTYEKISNSKIKKCISDYCVRIIESQIYKIINNDYKSNSKINVELEKIVKIINENNEKYIPDGKFKIIKKILFYWQLHKYN